MAEYVTREEFEARVGVLEQEVEGEKVVTRYILEQTRRNGDDLASLKTRLDRVETRLESVEKGLNNLSSSFQAHVRSLPAMMRDVMREVLQEGDPRPSARPAE